MQTRLTGHWKQIAALWVVAVVIYVAIGLGLNQARVSLFSAAQQREIFAELQDTWCSNMEIADRSQRGTLDRLVTRTRMEYKLTELDMRIIFQRQIDQQDAVQPCLYEAVTWTQCVAETDYQLALNIGGTFGLSSAETDSILALGASQGWSPHACLTGGEPSE